MKNTLLVWAAALIFIFLILQIIRGFLFAKRKWKKIGGNVSPELSEYIKKAEKPSKAREVLREIDAKAIELDSHERALLFSTAAVISLTVLKRAEIAIRYNLRALRSDPLCVTAFDRLAEILMVQKKYHRFEMTCWNLLSRLDDEDQGGEMWTKCWSGLETIYSKSKRHVSRADAIRKMISSFESETAEGFEED
ncbi:MAG: hypothetical protein JXR91_10740 [Deltaproteobacteria bacterium]|nr:hypothetical protein [Deltaproteobacteria bacterium]